MLQKRIPMKTIPFLLILMIVVMSCNEKKSDPEKWNDKELNGWFENQEWLTGWDVQPDASINKRTLAVQYHKNQEIWDQAFNFLKTSDLQNIPVGRQDLVPNELFVIVSEYISKEKSETRYESHKNFLDIQYVISGKELMGITTADNVTVDEPYNETNDIAFHTFEGGDYRLATPGNFLVFFPADVHRPSVADGEGVPVKKIVVKIRIK